MSGSSIVRIVDHGSSDNAASYGVRVQAHAPVDSVPGLDLPHRPLRNRSRHAGRDRVGLSQSGRTPDVVSYLGRRARAAPRFAANSPRPSWLPSPAVLPLDVGSEHAVAATKTYLNQVAALACLRPT